MANLQVTAELMGSSGNEMFTSHNTSTKGQEHFCGAVLPHGESTNVYDRHKGYINLLKDSRSFIVISAHANMSWNEICFPGPGAAQMYKV